MLESEKEKLELKMQLAKKSEENESILAKVQQLEQTMHERFYLQDSKLHTLQAS